MHLSCLGFVMSVINAVHVVQIVEIVVVSTKTVPKSLPGQAASGSAIDLPVGTSNQDPWYAEEFLLVHNQLRQLHQSQPMAWNSSVASVAQENAAIYQCGSALKHLGKLYGENLASGFTIFTKAMYAWFNESSDYNYIAANQYNHFTQMVWNSSTQLGCAVKNCSANTYYIVCNYYPQGNIIGQGKANVFPTI